MFRVERAKTAPLSLSIEKNKTSGSYRQADVVNQLRSDFFNKCYICEMKDCDPVVEHLIPHHNNKKMDLKFDWNNLFYSCGHCNSVKNRKEFEGNILDCTKEDVLYTMKYIWSSKKVTIVPLNQEIKTIKTSKLIELVFNGDSLAIRNINCENRMKFLNIEITKLKQLLIDYKKQKKLNDHKQIKNTKKQIVAILSKKSAFSAFKKWTIINKENSLPEFQQYIND